jgi:dTDP-4-amino-4,6-dideoxygalactose transaminase
MPEWPNGRCNRWLTVVLINAAEFGATTEQVRLALESENIESRPVWKPMHLQPVFKSCRVRGGSVSERLFRDGLCLPSGTAMTDLDIERVAEAVRRCAKNAAGLKR